MTAFLAVNDFRAVTARLTVPRYGAWVSDVSLAAEDKLAKGDAVTLSLGDLTLKGTVLDVGAFGGAVTAQLRGGGKGWNTEIKPKGYSHEAGVKLSAVLQDAAQAAGETMPSAGLGSDDRSIGPGYARRAGPASRTLKKLVGGKWWIDEAGVTQIKERPGGLIAVPFTVLEYRGMAGLFRIATENYKDWMPGRSFQAVTVAGAHEISSVTFAVKDGKVELTILDTSTKEERLLQEMRSIIRDEVCRLTEHGTIVQYVVTKASEDMVIDCKPADGESTWPALSNVKLTSSLAGETVTSTVGNQCLIFFLDGDPTKFRCMGIQGTQKSTKFQTSEDFTVLPGGLMKVAGASEFVALGGKVDSNFSTWASSFASHVHPTGVGPSGPPAAPLPPGATASVQSAKLKSS